MPYRCRSSNWLWLVHPLRQGGGAVEPVLCPAEAEGPWHARPLLAAGGHAGLCVRHPPAAVPHSPPDAQLRDQLP